MKRLKYDAGELLLFLVIASCLKRNKKRDFNEVSYFSNFTEVVLSLLLMNFEKIFYNGFPISFLVLSFDFRSVN